MTFTIPDPTVHAHLYLIVAAIILGMAVASRIPVLRAALSVLMLVGLGTVLVTAIDQRAGLDPRLAGLGSLLPGGDQDVVGRETRIPMSSDGHFWVEASINGVRRRMLVDTGATATTLSSRTAAAARLELRAGLLPIVLQTANGSIVAKSAVVRELRVGNIVARNVDVVVAPGMGDVDVVGMNFLTRLKGWRMEEGTLLLTPHHPQGDERGLS